MKGYLEAALFLVFLCSSTSASRRDAPIASTPLGRVRGVKATSRGGREYLAFPGVPYAKPPVGELALEAPEPLAPWSGVKDVRKNGPYCMQYNLYDIKPEAVGQLDCLYLAVYTHNLAGNAPVLVHFHGGGFISGNGANRTGPQYMMDEDVVIVDVNYRVGIFGFLSFEDADLPGNQGMKDQVMALRWVQQNIASFGGDPERVTLVGESAGAGSVYHHTVSPLSKGLFHGGIAQSGSSYGLWSLAPKGFTRNLSMKLLKMLGCSYTNTKEAVTCIRSKDPKVVASQLENFKEWQIDPIFNFGPVMEEAGPGAFLVGPISKWKHCDVPLLMGMDSAEGLLRTGYFPFLNMSYEWYSDNFERLAPISLLYFASASDPDQVTREVKRFYFPAGRITEADWRNLTTMYTDAWIAMAVMEGADKHPGDVFFYYFDYVGEKSFWGDASTRNTTIIFGANHNEEMLYIWYSQFQNGFEGEDLELSKKLVKIWTDFAKYGSPTGPGSRDAWGKWTPERHRYMEITHDGFNMKEGIAEDRYRFWQGLNYKDNYD